MKYLIFSVLVVSLVGLMIPSAFAENVPAWVKNTAGWWATDAISETEFVNAIEFLVKENIIQVDASQTSETSQDVPSWVKNTAGWWATDAISETEFVNAIAYLIKIGIISIESNISPELIAEMWVNGDIDDNEFLANVEHLIEIDSIAIPNNSVTKTSQLPDWLVNNAGWWAARILTNSDFEFNPGYVKEEIFACEENSMSEECFKKTYNSLGLRGDEIKKEKPDNTFRIFAVGGSTTFGHTALDSETWPALLQQIINEKITGKKIEVINAGISGGTSESGYNLIKNKLLSFDPDLIIMYDGWNDSKQGEQNDNVRISPKETIHNWKSVCKLGNNEGFDTIIVVQPLPLTGQRVLTEQEIEKVIHSVSSLYNLHKFQQYVDALEELDEVCTKTADFRRIFDYIQEPVFFDNGHTLVLGNKIIAENVFSVISPIYFDETHSVIQNDLNSENNGPETGVVYAVGADLSGKNFDNLNLQNAVFDKADLSNTSFKNANIDGARFVFANLDNSNLLDRIDLSDINLAGANISNVSLKGKDLSGTILTGADLSNSNLTGVDLSGKDLTKTILIDVNLSNSNLTGANLTGANLKGANVKNVDFTSADLTNAKFRGVDISMGYLSTMNLTKVDLSGAILTNADLSEMDLSSTDLSGQDLSDKDLTNTILTGANLTDVILPDGVLSGKNFEGTKFNGVDLSGKDLSHSNFQYATFDNANLEGANLTDSTFIQVDFTKIKNKSLAGADLSNASFAYSNLSGVNLAGVILHTTNFWKADLSGVDFTVTDGITDGAIFIEAILPNSNFEDVDLSPKTTFTTTFKNKAYLYNSNYHLISEDLFSEITNILIISTEVRGNDLAVSYIFFNSFANANLENANFKNADLRQVNFYSAKLTNADLSGADLRKAFLGDADLSNANLDGADLTGAFINENTILKCNNHPICNSS